LLKSVRQFFQSIFLRVSKEDIKAFDQYLNIGEHALFMQLPEYEKVHAILTAKKMQKLVHSIPDVNERKMVRAALLHDVGRISGKVNLFDKVWLKLAKYFLPPVYHRLAARGQRPGSKFKKFYVHKHHGEVAGEFLKRAGTDKDIIELIVKHTDKTRPSDPKELSLLRQADRTS